jgi:vacuolar-type H+-ATPase catalytic subunit A/Vma1
MNENIKDDFKEDLINPEILLKNREELRKKFLLQKENTKKEKTTSINSKDEYLLNLLKQNPEFKNALNDNNNEMNSLLNTMIQNMINKMTNDPKQKKIMKKKIKSLIENMNNKIDYDPN